MLFTGSTGKHRLQQHDLWADEHERGDQPGVHFHGRAGEEQYFLDRRVRGRGCVSETSTAYDYNDYYSASGTPFSWGGTAYTFANWQTNSSQDAHSLNSNPTLTNARRFLSGGNFTLLADLRRLMREQSGVRVSVGAVAGFVVARRSCLVNQNTAGPDGRWALMFFRRTVDASVDGLLD